MDITGNSALCVLIEQLPNLATEALNQLHTSDVITSREYYYLQYLEASRQKLETKTIRTPLEAAVVNRKYEVVTHPVIQRLIHNKWKKFGRFSTLFQLLFHAAFAFAWTAFSLGTPERGKDTYNETVDQVWKIALGVFILLMTFFDIGTHFQGQYYKTIHSFILSLSSISCVIYSIASKEARLRITNDVNNKNVLYYFI